MSRVLGLAVFAAAVISPSASARIPSGYSIERQARAQIGGTASIRPASVFLLVGGGDVVLVAYVPRPGTIPVAAVVATAARRGRD